MEAEKSRSDHYQYYHTFLWSIGISPIGPADREDGVTWSVIGSHLEVASDGLQIDRSSDAGTALVSILTLTTGHVVAANISLFGPRCMMHRFLGAFLASSPSPGFCWLASIRNSIMVRSI